MSRRGMSLMAVLWFIGMCSVFFIGSRTVLGEIRQRQNHARYQQEARNMAFSGLEYGRAMLARGRWDSAVRRSPDLDGGWFEVRLENGRIRSIGHAGPATVELSGP